jgi:two-component system sensor histidine kinase KdpD
VSATSRVGASLDSRSVALRLPKDLSLISVDPVLFEQVFVNLLENAAKYTPAGSPIEVIARGEPQALKIEVRDSGPGFAPGTEARIFEKFFRGQAAPSSGVGLGLAICRGIVEAHGGSIVASNRQGGGAVFEITLPVIGVPPEMPAEDTLEAEAAGS